MGIKTLNSVGGVSVGLQPANVILSNADVISNNLTVGKTASLGDVSNVKILGGSANYVLKTDGQGNLSWTAGAGSPGGANTEIQFNDGGSFNGVSNFTYNKNTNLLAVNGNVTVGDNTNNVRLFSSGAISATGNLSAANINTGGVLSVTGNANVGNIGATNGVFTNISGTLTTASQTGITAVGTLTSLNVSGNANAGNIGATNGVFTNVSGNGALLTDITGANITGTVPNAAYANTANASLYSNTVARVSGNYYLTFVSGSTTGNYQLGTNSVFVANIANGSISATTFIGNLSGTGNSNVGNLGVTGVYATTLSATGNANIGNIGTAGILTVTGNANVGNIGATNGVFTNVSGNGALLTSITGASVTGTVANANYATTAGTVVNNAQPNITSVGTLTSLDSNGNVSIYLTSATTFSTGFSVYKRGTTGDNTAALTSGTELGYHSFYGWDGAAYGRGAYALAKTTEAWNASNRGANYSIAVTANGTSAPAIKFTIEENGNVKATGNMSVTGNANVGNIGATNGVFTNVSGNGALLTSITGANVTGTVANATYATTAGSSGSATSATTAVTVTANSQPNITSVGTLSSLNIDGNLVVGNNLFVNGNLTYLNVETVAVEDPIIQLQTGANGTAPSSNSGKDVGTALNYYDTAAKIAFMGWDTSNAEIALASNVSIANEVVTFTNLANTRTGNLLTTGVFAATLSASGNANVGNIGATGVYSTTLSATGNANVGNIGGTNAVFTNIAGTLTTAAQPNITSVGTLTSLSVSGNANIGNIGTSGLITAAGNIQAGNLSITGNANVGNLGISGLLTVAGNIQGGNLSITGNANIANIGTSGLITAAGNIQAGNLRTTGILSVGGNANVGNLGTTGLITATGNIDGGNLRTANILSVGGNANIGNIGVTGVYATTLSATGNANVGNIGVAGIITATGNITGGNVIATLHVGNLSGTGNSNVGNLGVTGVFATTLSATGNANVGNISGTNGIFTNISGNLTTANQPNITSLGTLTTLSVSGNANIGNLGLSNLIIGNTNTTTSNSSILGWSYSGVSLSISAQEGSSTGLYFKSDGTALYIIGSANDRVFQYTLSQAWDVTTGVVAGNVSVGSQDGTPTDLFISSDGTKMYIVGDSNNSVYQYTLSTPWDVTSATYASKSFSVGTQETSPTGLYFSPDLANMYVCGSLTDAVYQYTLSTPGDVSTASYSSKSISLVGIEAGSLTLTFDSTGTRMFVTGSGSIAVHEFILGTAWDLNTATYTRNAYYVGWEENTPSGIYADIANNKLWVSGATSDAVYQYNTDNSYIITANAVGITNQLNVAGNVYLEANATVGSNLRVLGSTTVTTFTTTGAVVASTTTSNIVLGTSQTTGNFVVGGTAQTGQIILGQSTATQVINIGIGATTNANTKTINIASNGVANSQSNVTIFSDVAGNSNLIIGASTGNTVVSFTANTRVTIANTGASALSVAGNVTGSYFIGNGSQLTGIVATSSSSLANGTSNVTIPVANGAILFATNGTANRVVISDTGNVGIGTSNPAYELEVIGTLAATSKSFLIDHPTKTGWKLQYGSLESPYHGIRLTGEAAIVNGYCKIDLPDYIHGLVKQEGSQVQITNKQHGRMLWIDEIDVNNDYFIVKGDVLPGDDDKQFAFYWSFTAIRKDIAEIDVEFN